MEAVNSSNVFNTKLTSDEFEKLSTFINTQYGIKMPLEKKTMLQCRLQKRLRDLNFDNFKSYIDFAFSEEGKMKEVIHMIDVVTTNKTDFYREPSHFDFLTSKALPEMSAQRQLKVWSAGCSSGEEVYTLAIVLEEYGLEHQKFDYKILGTDISSKVLQLAMNAVYKEEKVHIIPNDLKKKYLLRSKDRVNKTVRIVKELRQKAMFERLNFMSEHYEVKDTFDIIFCRNVLIYFNRKTQEEVISKLIQKLRLGGYFFLGHSESIMGMNLPLRQIKPTIFKKI